MPEDLEVVLSWMSGELPELTQAADTDLDAARQVGRRIEPLEERIAALTGGLQTAPSGALLPTHLPRRATSSPAPTWAELRAEASTNLLARGVDPSLVNLDDLLDPAEVRAIERRFSGGFSIKASLDRYDMVFAVIAGITAAVTDFLVVRIPKDLPGANPPLKGSPLTKALRDHAIESDNWLGKMAHVPYDQVSGMGKDVPGIGPKTHRPQTVGHDPLLGLIVGTLDIMRGSMTAITKTGAVTVIQGVRAPVPNPLVAFATQVAHLCSDAPTRMGLPLPGWSILMSAPFGNVDGLQINELARQMYLRGYDSWHLLTMATTPATVELVLRAYWGLRCHLDEEYREEIAHEAHIADSSRVSDHPRYRSLALAAHGVAAGANLAKLIAYGGNPLELNAAEWFAFLRAFFCWTQDRLEDPTDVLLRHVSANRLSLDAGWAEIGTGGGPFPEVPWPERPPL